MSTGIANGSNPNVCQQRLEINLRNKPNRLSKCNASVLNGWKQKDIYIYNYIYIYIYLYIYSIQLKIVDTNRIHQHLTSILDLGAILITRYCWWFRNPAKQPPFGCKKTCESWDKLPTSSGSQDFWAIKIPPSGHCCLSAWTPHLLQVRQTERSRFQAAEVCVSWHDWCVGWWAWQFLEWCWLVLILGMLVDIDIGNVGYHFASGGYVFQMLPNGGLLFERGAS